MKNLQNNFTTPKQSKMLLELGVPIYSADLYYNKFGALEAIPEYRNFSEFCDSTDIPCWSVGRLIEICKICEQKKYYEQLCEELQYSQNYCVVIISHIIANLPIIDFSKLEE